jgi:hypothetical protein
MSKITQTTRLDFEVEQTTYALPPKIIAAREMSAAQAAAMAFMCGDEAKRSTGYEPVPIEVLRDDLSIHQLLDMLETCRPGGSIEEEDFIATYLGVLTEPYRDEYGNVVVQVPIPEGHPRILWSCHTDTVHRHGGTQKVEVTSGIAWTSNGSCLGSDDTVGIWLALEMIKAEVPGTYVFHRDEESGGQGSSWMAKHAEDWLGQFDCAIALDRAGYADVITHQSGGRCCSEAFANSVAALLGGAFKPCDSGVFTDTANYVDVIGECTNLSVGYFRQHGPMEHTNLSFAASLRDALVSADWAKLVFERKPGEEDPDWQWGRGWEDDKYGTYVPRKDRKDAPPYGDHETRLDDMEQFVREYPWVVAEYLLEMGVDIEDLDLYEPGDLAKVQK